MIPAMRFQSRLHPPLAVLLLIAAVSAASPVVRRCPFDLDRMDLQSYVACAAMPKTGDCRADAAACEETAACAMRTRGAVDPPSCPMSAAAVRADAPTCPLATAAHAVHDGCTSCPFPAKAPHSSDRRNVCIGEPGMAGAARAHPPARPAPLAILATILTIEAPETARPVEPAAVARPPTPAPLARPSIRGPPGLLA